eukprot:4278231-Ditylum_brightwellii.AAC.1
MQMTENTEDKKKAAISETGDKKVPAKYRVEEVEGHVMYETVPVASKIDNIPLKKKACALMENKTPASSPGGRKVRKKLV